MENTLFTKEVKYCKGIGARYSEILQKKNIYTLYDLLTFFPREYEDRTRVVPLGEALDSNDKTSVVLVEVVDITTFSFQYRNKPLIIITDGISIAEIPIYGGRLAKFIEKGKKIYVTGKFKRNYRGRVQCQMIEIEEPSAEPVSYGKIVPIYPLTEGLSQKKLRSLIQQELINFQKNPSYSIPKEFIKKCRMSFIDAITERHFPSSFERLDNSRNALVLEEFLAFQYVHLIERRPNILIKTRVYKETSYIEKVNSILPFSLTDDQRQSLGEISNDLLSKRQMFRLLQGDVGSGKTIVALLASLIVIDSGYQVAILAPTEILVKQHYKTIKAIIKNAGLDDKIFIDILSSSNTDAERGYTIKRLREGRTSLLVSTHSILSDEVVFKNIGMAIVDEQHRFGTEQRDKLLHKGQNVDYLLMTATPIPQSLAFAIFGELDTSIIKTMPKNRKSIHTKCVEKNERDHCYRFLQSRVKKGEQGYVIFPFIDDHKENSYINLKDTFAYAKETYFQDINIEMLHGKMKDDEKSFIMSRFIDGEIDILFSTSVIEVGIDNQNATTMLIEGAERFGLSQIHQMRGRVGRGDKEGYCYLMLHAEMNEVIQERIDIIISTTDGFVIAERDLEMRGSGQFLGRKQSGLADFKIGSLYKDIKIMEYARDKMRLILVDEISKKKFIEENAAFIERAECLRKTIAID